MTGLKILGMILVCCSIFLFLSCKRESTMFENEQRSRYVDARKPYDFVALRIEDGRDHNIYGANTLWIKNKTNIDRSLETTLKKENIKYERKGIYHIIHLDNFKEFSYRGVIIQNKDGKIFLNKQKFTGNATLSEKDELTMDSFYPTFY